MSSYLSILDAIRRGAVQEVRQGLAKNPKLLEKRDHFGLSLLHRAVDHPDILRLLLEAGAPVNGSGEAGENALHLVSQAEAARLLLTWGAQLEAPNKKGLTALHLAAQRGPEVAAVLLEAGANPNARGPEGETPLQVAARSGQVETLRHLLSHGCDLQQSDGRGWTALHHAATCAPDAVGAEATSVLLGAGADPGLAARDGTAALHLAAERGRTLVMQALLAAAPELLEAVRRGGDRALHLAAAAKAMPALRLLLAHGAQLEARQGAGLTALHVGASVSDAVVAALLEAGADPGAVDNYGRTPLHYAVSHSLGSVQALLRAGAPTSTRDKEGRRAVDNALGRSEIMTEVCRAMGLDRPPLLRFGFVHSLAGSPEVLVLQAFPFESVCSLHHRLVNEELRFEEEVSFDICPLLASSGGLRGPHFFEAGDSAEVMARRMNPLYDGLRVTAYDERIVIGRYFVFCRAGEADPQLLSLLGVTAPAVIPRFGMHEAGHRKLDLHLEPGARRIPQWQPHVSLAPIRSVFAPGEEVCVLARCAPAAGGGRGKAEVSLLQQDYPVKGTTRTVSVKGGLFLLRWPGLPEGRYSVILEWAGQEARWAFTVGRYSLALGQAEWADGPRLVEGHWHGKLRLRVGGRVMPPGVDVRMALHYQQTRGLTYDDGLVDVDILAVETGVTLEVKWGEGSEEIAFVPLPRMDGLKRDIVQVTGAEGADTVPVSGLHVAPGKSAETPLRLLEPIGEKLRLLATRPVEMAAVTVLDAAGGCRTTALGQLAEGQVREVDLPQAAGTCVFVCLGALHGNQVYETAFPFYRPPTFEVSCAGPGEVAAGGRVSLSVRVQGPAARRVTLAVVAQDARLECPFESEVSDRALADLQILAKEVDGPAPPSFSQAWLDGAFELRHVRRSKQRRNMRFTVDLLPTSSDSEPAQSQEPGARPYPHLTGPPPRDSERRWSRMMPGQALRESLRSETVLADMVKLRGGVAPVAFTAPTEPCLGPVA